MVNFYEPVNNKTKAIVVPHTLIPNFASMCGTCLLHSELIFHALLFCKHGQYLHTTIHIIRVQKEGALAVQ